MTHPNDRHSKSEISKLLTAIIECSTIMPFRWCDNKFMCFYCACPFVDSSKLKQHTSEEHSDAKLKNVLRNNRCSRIKLDISDISCKMCPKRVSTVEEFLDHIMCVHDIKIDRNHGVSLLSFKLNDECMQCLDCGQSFRFFGPLLTHVHRFHAKVNTFLCDICGHGFVAKVNLYSHVKNVHSNCNFKWEDCKINGVPRGGDLSLKCPQCPEIFRSSYLRKQHLALIHEVKGFKCEECSSVFTCKSRLVEHKSRIHLKEKTFACEICGFKVFSKDLLKRHMVKHDDARPFQCEYCKKAFQRKKTLNIHRRIHTNDRRYTCKECGKAFIQYTSLKLHVRVHHNTMNT